MFIMDDQMSSKSNPPPLRAIAIQQQTPTSIDVNNDVPLTDSMNSFDCDSPAFELMQVSITVYGINGILCKTKERQGKFLKKRRSFLKKANNKSGEEVTLNETTRANIIDPHPPSSAYTSSSHTISNNTPESLSLLNGMNQPPITAVVSYMKNVFSSKTKMETYIPSRPLDRQSRPEARTLQYAATWPGWAGDSELQPNDHHAFNVARVMKQQQYQATKMAKVSTHVPETIELCVFVGKGKDILPLGVTSFVITGDEEEEVIHNAPVRLPRPGSSAFDDHFVFSGKKKKPQKPAFKDNPRQIYELDSNATLQLGVRVFPQSTLNTAVARQADEKAMDDKEFKLVLTELLGDVFGEGDDNSKDSNGFESLGVDDDIAKLLEQGEIKVSQVMEELGKEKKISSERQSSLIIEESEENIDPGSSDPAPFSGSKLFKKFSEVLQSFGGVKEITKCLDVDDATKAGDSPSNQNLSGSSFLCGGVEDVFPEQSTRAEQHARGGSRVNLKVSTQAEDILSLGDPTVALPLSLVSSVSESVSARGSEHCYPTNYQLQ